MEHNHEEYATSRRVVAARTLVRMAEQAKATLTVEAAPARSPRAGARASR